MRKVAVVTVARSDYGIYSPLLRKLRDSSEVELQIIVGGMHLAPEFGLTIKAVEADGFQIAERVEMLLASDTPEGIAKSMGVGLLGFAGALARLRPDLIVILGDRFDMIPAALAAVPFGFPVAHIHGGELTFGAIDDVFRHAITKMSHLHFVTTEEYGQRVIQMGEDPWRVEVTGAMALDEISSLQLLSREELSSRLNADLTVDPLLVTFHPVTLELENTEAYTIEVLEALLEFGRSTVFTLPNADPGGRLIRALIGDFVAKYEWAYMVENFGTRAYFSMMKIAAAMVGNSSSGILEAPSFGLPVVNIGSRQAGRVRGVNVIDTGYSREAIVKGIEKALSPEFREVAKAGTNPYYCGGAADRMMRVLLNTPLNTRLIQKQFFDVQPRPVVEFAAQ